MNYEYITKKVEIEIRDRRSGHLWKYEINTLKPLIHIYKNGEHKRTSQYLQMPISETWLEEIREGL